MNESILLEALKWLRENYSLIMNTDKYMNLGIEKIERAIKKWESSRKEEGQLIKEINSLELDKSFNGHYHSGAQMMKEKILEAIKKWEDSSYKNPLAEMKEEIKKAGFTEQDFEDSSGKETGMKAKYFREMRLLKAEQFASYADEYGAIDGTVGGDENKWERLYEDWQSAVIMEDAFLSAQSVPPYKEDKRKKAHATEEPIEVMQLKLACRALFLEVPDAIASDFRNKANAVIKLLESKEEAGMKENKKP